jgi:tetratricopeptide (TPR) repeat protein
MLFNYSNAEDALSQKNYKEAENYWSKAINLDDSNVYYYEQRSTCFLKLNDVENAIQDAEICIHLDHSYLNGSFCIAYCVLLTCGCSKFFLLL